MAEVKGGSDSNCWDVGHDDYDGRLQICIIANPTSSEELRKWRILMTKSETELIITLRGYYDTDWDLKSFNTIYIPLFCDMLKNNMVIKELTLEGRILNDVGLKYVCRVLQAHSTITVFRLIGFLGSD